MRLASPLCALPTNMKAQNCRSKNCSTNQRNFLLPHVAPSLPNALNSLNKTHTETHIHLSISHSVHLSIHASISPNSLSLSGLTHFIYLTFIHFKLCPSLSFSSRNHKFCLFALIMWFIFAICQCCFWSDWVLDCGFVTHSRSYQLNASKLDGS